MSNTDTAAPDTGTAPAPKYRRKLRNYLIDVGLQIRYTAFIIMIAVFLTAVLGYKIYDATQDSSKIILMTGLVDPATEAELRAQFRSDDRVVLFGVLGFGMVAGAVGGRGWASGSPTRWPARCSRIEGICARVRDNKLAPSLRQQLRRGDELQDFYSTFRDMYEALRTRADRDVQVLGEVIARLEQTGADGGSARESVEKLRELRRDKQGSLEP